ncbi:ABC transporter permease [Flavobacterium sp. SM2513]|uniref:ABC transporter permease n=1 Tax=Flavobacterium sp. SM2513 TaxID=3424766 RepID=UPI003D7F2DAE
MVDWISEINNEAVKTVFEIKNDNIFVENNFFSEIGLIENAAQTCSSIVGQSFFSKEPDNEIGDVKVIGFISGIKKVKVIALPEVGQLIYTNAVLSSRFDTDEYIVCTMICNTICDKEIIFEAEINLFIQEKK